MRPLRRAWEWGTWHGVSGWREVCARVWAGLGIEPALHLASLEGSRVQPESSVDPFCTFITAHQPGGGERPGESERLSLSGAETSGLLFL